MSQPNNNMPNRIPTEAEMRALQHRQNMQNVTNRILDIYILYIN